MQKLTESLTRRFKLLGVQMQVKGNQTANKLCQEANNDMLRVFGLCTRAGKQIIVATRINANRTRKRRPGNAYNQKSTK